MIVDGLLTILQTVFGWLFYLLLQMVLTIVFMLEKLFNVFAGTETVTYNNQSIYLLELFIGHNAVTKIFWAMAIIGIILSFGFTIVAVVRKVTDVSGTTKHTLGQIISQFIRSLIIILLLNLTIVVTFNVTSVVFDRINFALENAYDLDSGYEREYTDEEFAVMTRILATIGNYSANPSAESRYNVNACFNAIRGDLSTLHLAGCFDFDFPGRTEGKDTWQSALAQVVKSANLAEDLQLDTYYAAVSDSIINIFDNLKNNPNFKPQRTAVRGSMYGDGKGIDTATMIFLVCSMGAEENEQFRNGSLDDALRRSYISGEKDYSDFSDVFSDFAITEINYVAGIIVGGGVLYCFLKVILMFVTRMINLVVLYVTSPLFVSSMSLDEGSRFQGWLSSFIMQLLASFGCVVSMRIYLLMVPIVTSSKMNLFGGEYLGEFVNTMGLEYFGQLLFLLGGAWAVSKASTLISGVLSNNAAGAFLEADSATGNFAWGITKTAGKYTYGLPFVIGRKALAAKTGGASEAVAQKAKGGGGKGGLKGDDSKIPGRSERSGGTEKSNDGGKTSADNAVANRNDRTEAGINIDAHAAGGDQNSGGNGGTAPRTGGYRGYGSGGGHAGGNSKQLHLRKMQAGSSTAKAPASATNAAKRTSQRSNTSKYNEYDAGTVSKNYRSNYGFGSEAAQNKAYTYNDAENISSRSRNALDFESDINNGGNNDK